MDVQEIQCFCRKHGCYVAPPLSIELPVDEVKSGRGRFSFKEPKEDTFFVGSDRWSELSHSGEKLINLLSPDCLEALLPSRGVHLVTFQNGIMNSRDDFIDRGEAIFAQVGEHFRETPLVIGFYNPTTSNVLFDGFGAIMRYLHINNQFVVRTGMFFETLLGLFTIVKRGLRWVHISHSEGGAIAHLALGLVIGRQRRLQFHRHSIENHLISASYGPLIPVPDRFGLNVFNTYSEKDNTTLRFGKRYLDHPNYQGVKLVPCLDQSPPRSSLPPGDHDFLGGTYQKAFRNNLEDILKDLKEGKY